MEKKHFSIRETFGPYMPENGAEIPEGWTFVGNADCTDNVPEVDPDYMFGVDLFNDILNWMNGRDTDMALFYGPPGCGKTSSLRQFCALTNIPVYEKTVYRRMRFEELCCRAQLLNGNTLIEYGVLPKAMGHTGEPGVLLLNEVDHAQEGVLTGLNEVAQGDPLDLLGFETVKPIRGEFKIACTANTGLFGDTTGLMRGAVRQNYAFTDRLWRFECGYLDAEREVELLRKKVQQMPERYARILVDIANEIRSAFMGVDSGADALEITISTRSLIRWARGAIRYKGVEGRGINPILYALDKAILGGVASGVSPETRQTVLKIVENKIPDINLNLGVAA